MEKKRKRKGNEIWSSAQTRGARLLTCPSESLSFLDVSLNISFISNLLRAMKRVVNQEEMSSIREYTTWKKLERMRHVQEEATLLAHVFEVGCGH